MEKARRLAGLSRWQQAVCHPSLEPSSICFSSGVRREGERERWSVRRGAVVVAELPVVVAELHSSKSIVIKEAQAIREGLILKELGAEDWRHPGRWGLSNI